MPNVDKHKPGAFCWFELATTDLLAAKRFYTSLFDWNVNDYPMGPGDVYSMFQLQGREVAAAYTIRPEQQAQGIPPHWMLYVAVDSADESARRAGELGATVYAAPFDVSEYGRMAVIADPTGAAFSVWQAKQHQGIGIAGENGTVCWADLSTPEADKAKQFYSGLFGWKITHAENDPSGYLHIKNGEDFIGGIPPAAFRNPNVPPHWLIYFLVADCDTASKKAGELGSEYLLPPYSMPNVGRMAILKDPQGAVFALFQPEKR